MARSSLTGSGSYMPIDFYLKKNEVTCMEYNPEQTNNYWRQTLRDFREPPSIFEEDMHRYDNHSREKLNLRHTGDRSGGIQPWLPDGTFLDQTFLSPDGNSTLPDFQNLRSQIDMRVRNIPLYQDNDHSIPSQERTANEMTAAKDQIFKRARRDMKIFDTSKDYIQIPGTIGKPLMGGSQLKKLIAEQTPDFLSQEASSNRNWQVDMSNTLPIGWQTTPDGVFKVSRYDTPRRMADMRTDSYKNKIAAKLDTDFTVSYEDKNIPRTLALTIQSIMNHRKQLESLQRGTTIFGNSNQETNRKIAKLDERLAHLMRQYSIKSGAASANQLLGAEGKNYARNHYAKADPDLIKKSVVSLQVADLVKQAANNRKLGKQNSDDLRAQIAQSAALNILDVAASNPTKKNFDESNEHYWNSLLMHERGEQFEVFNYANVKFDGAYLAGKHKMFEVEEYERLKHPDLAPRRQALQDKMYKMENVEWDLPDSLDTPMRNVGGIKKSRNSMHLTTVDRYTNELNEVDSRLFTQPGRIVS